MVVKARILELDRLLRDPALLIASGWPWARHFTPPGLGILSSLK